jgi:acylphosphatase
MDEVVMRLEIRGRVQGVGYRWSMVEAARELGIRGWVRNRHEGWVEAMVLGPAEAVSQMVAWARRGSASAAVDAVDVFPGTGNFTVFEQRPSA